MTCVAHLLRSCVTVGCTCYWLPASALVMGSWLNAALCYANVPEVKAMVESFAGADMLVTQAKVSL